MEVLLGIRNFGKIKSAEINLSGFSVLVGNNNSGKTYLMQLIYGIRRNLPGYLADSGFCASHLCQLEKQVQTGRVLLDYHSIGEIELFLNKILEKNKEKIVLETFHEEIEIGQIYVRLLMEEGEQSEWLIYKQGDAEETLNQILANLNGEIKSVSERLKERGIFQKNELGFVLFRFRILNGKKECLYSRFFASKVSVCTEIAVSAADLLIDEFEDMLFLPASRTGLLMLYKEFFASKADEAVKIWSAEDFEPDKKESRKLGITQPVYDSLRFMQTFARKKKSAENKSLIQFIEKYLIEGKILVNQANQAVYQAQGAGQELPLYLSSSMVNELMPLLYVLQSTSQPTYFIWDEIETSLHPQKQMELARLLSRMSNAGFTMIVSTHSDTMAAKINNLCLLSFSQLVKGKRAEILNKAGLEEADLFQDRIHVYQFLQDDSGKSVMKESEYDEVTGYTFTLFQDSVEKLFQETRLILE